MLTVLRQLQGNYERLNVFAESANEIRTSWTVTNKLVCRRMDKVIDAYRNAPDPAHSAKAAYFSTLHSMAQELALPLHPVHDKACAGTAGNLRIVTGLERERIAALQQPPAND